ncbi:hypothetical protein [Leisingera aquaemixtae]|uniref:2-keto-4-pentenoate hydratase n=1 Tax=Leisingera aquaemixtae TaxID=1396826 RepID=A0A0P1HP49_9RHOB|nr:hypothetical protein [Leisingera aquaemixtae]CUI01669.1 2-keto-4-pentenoate hydratase [Leisingera aquaemixtae]
MNHLVSALQDARAKGEAARITAQDLPRAVEEAYAAGLSQAPEVAAWKIGGANPWSRQVFANAEVFFGPLTPREVAVGTDVLSLAGLHAPLAEPELMLELGDDLEAELPFARMGLGFEIPASVLPDGAKSLLTGQMADRAGAGALWIGAVQPFDAARCGAAFVSHFRRNGAAAAEGGSGNIIGGPVGAAKEFLALARRHGMPLAQGQWIATGGLSPAVPAAPGDLLECRAMDMEVRLRLA